MTQKPTYSELEKRVRELEKMTADARNEESVEGRTVHQGSAFPKENDFETINVEAIIDVQKIQSLMNDFYELTGIGIAILDLNGKILVSTGWQDICTQFHRVHPETCRNCLESDLVLSKGVEPGTFKLYKCKNHMWDMATPIMLGDKKVGNLYLGQFLFDNESADVAAFRHQARKFGFEEDDYIAALERVPRWSRQTVDNVMRFYAKFAQLISELGYKQFTLKQNVSEKGELLDRLNESEKKFRELVENLNDVVYAVSHNGTITYVSPVVGAVLGYTDKELVGRNFKELLHKDDLSVVSEAFQDVLKNKLQPTEYRIQSKSNGFRWVRSSSRPVYREGQIIGLQGVLTDITDRRERENAIRERVKELQSFHLFSSLVEVSRGLHEILEGLPEILVNAMKYPQKTYVRIRHGNDVYESHPDGDKNCVDGSCVCLSKPLMAKGKSIGELRVCHAKEDALTEADPFLPEERQLVNTIAERLGRICERYDAEEALQKSEERFRQLSKIAFEAIVIHDQGIVLEANDQYFKMFGYQRDELIGKEGIARTATPGSQQIIKEQINEGSLGPYQATGKRKDGTEFPMELRVIRMEYNGREVRAAAIRDLTKQKKTEEELRKSETTYRNLLNNLDAGVVVHAPDTSIMISNQSACRIMGLSENQMIGKEAIDPQWKFLHEDGRDMPIEDYPVNRLLSTKKGIHNQVVGVTRPASGDIAWVLVNGFPVLKDTVSIEKVVITFVDITEIKRFQQTLLEYNEKMRLAADSAHFGVWDLHVKENRLEWDDWMFRLYGVSRDKFGGAYEAWQTGVHPDDLERSSREVEEALREEKEFDTEFRIVRPDGEIRHLKAHAAVTRDNIGEPVKMTGINYDITERKQAEEALWESTERFQKVFNSQLDAILVLNAEFPARIIDCNISSTKVFGYKPEELIGETTEKLHVDDSHLKRFQNELYAAIEKEGHLNDFEFFMKRKDGTRFPSEHSVFELKNDAGERMGWVSITRDLTERKRLDERLREAQKMESIGNLAGGIAHDFNNILFPISGLSELLMEDLPPNSFEHESAQRILQAAERGSKLVHQILAFSRKTEDEMLPIRIQPILKEILKLSRSTIPANIEIEQDIQMDCGLVMGDSTQIYQIGMNLITNAYHAVQDAGGRISVQLKEIQLDPENMPISTLKPGRYAMMAFEDTGKGIDPTHLEKIFEPYFTTKERDKGTGLGLAVAHGIALKHGGNIGVSSELGKGSVFHVYLPLIEKLGKTELDKGMEELAKGHERILLVDDEEVIVHLEQQILKRLGYNVTAFTRSKDALKVFKEKPDNFDLVITDMAMPDMTGVELAHELFKIRQDIPMIICTGFSDRINEQEARNFGIMGVLKKPMSRTQIARMVRNVIDHDNPS